MEDLQRQGYKGRPPDVARGFLSQRKGLTMRLRLVAFRSGSGLVSVEGLSRLGVRLPQCKKLRRHYRPRHSSAASELQSNVPRIRSSTSSR